MEYVIGALIGSVAYGIKQYYFADSTAERFIPQPENEYVYIIQLREFVNAGVNVYKIGRTSQGNPYKRLKAYPAGSSIKMVLSCANCAVMEKEIMKRFKKKFRQCTELSRGNNSNIEYFEGDLHEMMCEFIDIKKQLGKK